MAWIRQRASGRRRRTPRPEHRRVDEHAVERRGRERQRTTVGGDRVDRVQTQPGRGSIDEREPIRARVYRDDQTAIIHRLGQRGDLPAGRGADLEHALSRDGADGRGDGLAPLVLGSRAAVGDGSELAGVASPAHDERVGKQPAAFDSCAGRGELGRELVRGGPSGIRPQRERRRLARELQRGPGVLGPEVGEQPGDDPVRHGRADPD